MTTKYNLMSMSLNSIVDVLSSKEDELALLHKRLIEIEGKELASEMRCTELLIELHRVEVELAGGSILDSNGSRVERKYIEKHFKKVFEPKLGENILVRMRGKDDWVERRFTCKVEGKYSCRKPYDSGFHLWVEGKPCV